MMAVVFIIALMLPLEEDKQRSDLIPQYLHLSINQKLLAAFILGNQRHVVVLLTLKVVVVLLIMSEKYYCSNNNNRGI